MFELPFWARLLVDWLLLSIIVSLLVGPLLRERSAAYPCVHADNLPVDGQQCPMCKDEEA